MLRNRIQNQLLHLMRMDTSGIKGRKPQQTTVHNTLSPSGKAVNVRGVANRAVTNRFDRWASSLSRSCRRWRQSPPSTDNGDSVQEGSSVENTVAASNQAVARRLPAAEESAKQLKAAQEAYNAAQKKVDAAAQSQRAQRLEPCYKGLTDRLRPSRTRRSRRASGKIPRRAKAAVDKAEQQRRSWVT